VLECMPAGGDQAAAVVEPDEEPVEHARLRSEWGW
jgi:hypothetical protein